MLDIDVNHYVILTGIDCNGYSSGMLQHNQEGGVPWN